MARQAPCAQYAGLATHEEQALWRRWLEARDEQARAGLMALHMPYARVLAAKCYAARLHDGVEFEEYLQFANVALIETLERYDPSRGAQFRTFAHRRICGAILSGLELLSERQQQISVQQRLRAERLKLAAGTVEPAGAPADALFRYLAEVGLGLALATLLDGAMIQNEAMAHAEDRAFDSTELKQLSYRLQHCLQRLTQRERDVIKGHYLHAMSFEELARMLGISNSRVSQLHQQGLHRLRKLLASRDLCDLAW